MGILGDCELGSEGYLGRRLCNIKRKRGKGVKESGGGWGGDLRKYSAESVVPVWISNTRTWRGSVRKTLNIPVVLLHGGL